MAIECKTNCCTPAKPDYPMIMKSRHSGAIVLFSAPRNGTVLRKGCHEGPEIGEWSTGWNMSLFVPVSGDITLRNK